MSTAPTRPRWRRGTLARWVAAGYLACVFAVFVHTTVVFLNAYGTDPGAGFLTYEFVFATLPASLVVWLLLPPLLGLLPGAWFFLGGAALLWVCATAQAVLVWRALRGPRVT